MSTVSLEIPLHCTGGASAVHQPHPKLLMQTYHTKNLLASTVDVSFKSIKSVTSSDVWYILVPALSALCKTFLLLQLLLIGGMACITS